MKPPNTDKLFSIFMATMIAVIVLLAPPVIILVWRLAFSASLP